MQKPPFPANEAARLFSLQKMELLDTPAEEQFDRITRTAQRLFGVEICLISIVDRKRQWFKSTQGLDANETSREISFCGHTILKDEIMVVENTLNDERFADNPLVTGDPNIRFYAGCPLLSPDGFAIGTLCLIDSKPRTLNEADKASLRDLGGMVEDGLRPSPDAMIDKLTHLANRFGFEMIGAKMLSICKRAQTEAKVLFFDLDGFKTADSSNQCFGSLKDTGKDEADDVLELFAKILTVSFRESDLIARFGGGEFAVLVTGEEIDIDATLARVTKAASQDEKLVWSVGVAKFDPVNSELTDVIAEADTKMHENRRSRMSSQK